MKFKTILLLAMILLACACSSDNSSGTDISGDSGEKDAILTGTTWYDDDAVYHAYPNTDYDQYVKEIIYFLDITHSDSLYSSVDDHTTKTDSVQFESNPSKIIFGNSRCQLIDSTYICVNVKKSSFDCIKYTFKPGTYFIEGQEIIITAQQLNMGYAKIKLDNYSYYLRKNNGSYNQTREENKKDINVNIKTLDFTRTLYDVILSSGNIKYEGKIDTDKGELTIKQYSPTVGESKTYNIIQ